MTRPPRKASRFHGAGDQYYRQVAIAATLKIRSIRSMVVPILLQKSQLTGKSFARKTKHRRSLS